MGSTDLIFFCKADPRVIGCPLFEYLFENKPYKNVNFQKNYKKVPKHLLKYHLVGPFESKSTLKHDILLFLPNLDFFWFFEILG
jgi:hypothetical protein